MYAPPAAAPPPKKGMPTWMIVAISVAGVFVVVLPILSVLAVYGVRKYLVNAKTAEARNALGEIAKDAANAYARDHALCASATHAVPADIAMVRGTKYQAGAGEWDADRARNAGFACLGFSMEMPQYYQYSYAARGNVGEFAATARGDLDGDGKVSTFVVRGTVKGGELVIAPAIEETDPEE